MTTKKSEIILIEDRTKTLTDAKEELEAVGYFVWDCRSIFDARYQWDTRKNDIDLIITDLNLDPRSLRYPEQRIATCGGLFTGLVWLTDYVINDPTYNFNLLPRSIIFSEYISQAEINLLYLDSRYKDVYKKITDMDHLIRKGSSEMAYKKLIKLVAKITKQKKERK